MFYKSIIILLIIFINWPNYATAFDDIDSNWYKQAILELSENNIISGYDDGSFGPTNTITRAEILKVILKSANIEVSSEVSETCFPDVDNSAWFAKYICYAAENNIANGYDNWKFGPNDEVTVLEALAFASRAFELKIPKQGSWEWYDRYIDYAHSNKIIPEYSYLLDTQIKRWQSAELISRVTKKDNNSTLDYKSVWCSVSGNLWSSNTLSVAWKSRSYLLDLPKNYNSNTAYPLVLGLHGRTNSNAMVRDYMWLGGWKWQWVSEQNVIRAYPAGIGPGPYNWHQAENIDFIDAMLTQITEALCVDRSAVHIVGHSLWAYFSNRLACERWDVISTMTAVAGPAYNVACRGPVASLILHNRADPLVAFRDWENATKTRKLKNNCVWDAVTTTISGLSCQSWTNCSRWNPVHFCTEYPTYGDAPHSWPTAWANGIYKFIEDIR